MLFQQAFTRFNDITSSSAAARFTPVPHYLESLLDQAASSAPFLLGQTADDVNEDEIITIEPDCTGDGCGTFEEEPYVPGSYEYCEYTYDPYWCPSQSWDYPEEASKEDVHVIVWTSLWQWGFPLLIYDILAQKAMEETGSTDPDVYADREVRAWEEIAFWSAVTWGSTFVLTLPGLSEVLMPVSAFWIEHGLSNLMIPAYLRCLYLMLEVAILEEV